VAPLGGVRPLCLGFFFYTIRPVKIIGARDGFSAFLLYTFGTMEDPKSSTKADETVAAAADTNDTADTATSTDTAAKAKAERARAKAARAQARARKPVVPFSLYFRVMACLALLAVVLGSTIVIRSTLTRRSLERSWREMVSAYPVLVFQRVKFSKYLARGTVSSTDKRFARLDVYLVRGEADVQYSLAKFAMDERKTDYRKRRLALEYRGAEKFLVDVEILIDPGDVRLAESVVPRGFSEEESRRMAKTVALASGAVGAVVGGSAGATLGSALGTAAAPSAGGVVGAALSGLLPVSRYSGGIGALIGAASGGALAAGTGYLFTERFVRAVSGAAVDGSRGGQSPQAIAELIAEARPLICMEIVGGSGSGGADWEREAQAYYRREFEKRLAVASRRFGWESVDVDYGDGV